MKKQSERPSELEYNELKKKLQSHIAKFYQKKNREKKKGVL